MKILYVCSLTNFRHTGIRRKISKIQKFYEAHGHSFRLSINPEKPKFGIGFVSGLPLDIERFDFVFARLVLPNLTWKLKQIIPPVLVERHVQLNRPESVKDVARIGFEKIVTPLDYAKGLIYVTEEIRSFDSLDIPSIAIGNCSTLDFSEVASQSMKKKNVIGMSIGQFNSSHGVDIFHEISSSLSKISFELLVSDVWTYKKLRRYEGSNFQVYLIENLEEYVKRLSSWSVAVGPLASHRKGLSEAAPLKVRDYISLGIPTLVNYTDTNLDGLRSPVFKVLSANSNKGQILESLVDLLDVKFDSHDFNILKKAISVESVEEKRLKFALQMKNGHK